MILKEQNKELYPFKEQFSLYFFLTFCQKLKLFGLNYVSPLHKYLSKPNFWPCVTCYLPLLLFALSTLTQRADGRTDPVLGCL